MSLRKVTNRRRRMLRSLYTAYTGMYNEQKRMDILTNNLANVTTAGFKMESTASQSFDRVLGIKMRDASEAFNDHSIGTMSLGVKIGAVYTDFDQGSLRQTSGTYDLALSGKGFFNVRVVNQAGVESTKYTRDGNFRINRDGSVTDAYGNELLAEGGPLVVPVDADTVFIDRDGSVFADGQLVDRVLVTDFENYDYIRKFGDNFYEVVDGATEVETEATVLQGYIEQSNVSSVREMVNLISISRHYQANQKLIQSTDTILEHAANEVGKVG